MTVFFALLCAGLWGAMELLFLRLAKALGGLALLAWLALGGIVVALPLALLSGAPPGGSGALGAALAAKSSTAAVLHERFRARQWVGVALVIGSVSIVAAA